MPREPEWLIGALADPARGGYPDWQAAAAPEAPPDNPWARGVRATEVIARRPSPQLEQPPGWAGNLAEVGGRMSDLARQLDPSALIRREYSGIPNAVPGMLSDEEQTLANIQADQARDWIPQTAMSMVFDPALYATRGALTMGAGSKIIQPSKTPGRAAWRDAPNPDAPFPQYATEYPPVGPPVAKPKDKPKFAGETYLAKQPTPEAEAFKKERAGIIREMEKGFQPYFDPAKRFDVEAANYPLNIDTTQLVPKKPELVAQHLAKTGAEEPRRRLQEAYAKGVELGGSGERLSTQDWYQMGQLEDELVRALGPQAGRAAFRERFATPMAATTGGMDPRANLIAAGYQNYLGSRGQPWPQTHQWPFPVGARYGEQLSSTAQKIAEGGGFAALGEANPKRHNFAANFMGQRTPATLDEQMTQGMTPGKSVPDWYGINERIMAEEAAKVGVDPRKYQETGWHGFKGVAGTPMISEVNHAIERTHRLTGMPRSEIVRRGWGVGDIPIYAAPGAIGLGALFDQSRARD